eukprot:COSAG03_NODE_6317_length_1079_cov_6.039796_1_plen_83_part_10
MRRLPRTRPVPHKDFSELYEKMSGKGASAREAHQQHGIRQTIQRGDCPRIHRLHLGVQRKTERNTHTHTHTHTHKQREKERER